MIFFCLWFNFYFVFSLAPSNYFLDDLWGSINGQEKELLMTRPSQPSDCLEETIVSQLHKKLLSYSQTNKILLVSIDLGFIPPNFFVSKASLSLLDKLKDELNIYFLDVSYGLNYSSLASHIEWEDREKRYFEHRKQREGLFEHEADYSYVKQLMDKIQPDKIIFWGVNFACCLYKTIKSWRKRFKNSPAYLILTLSTQHKYELLRISRDTYCASYLKYLKDGSVIFFDLDFYEKDPENCVRTVTSDGKICRKFEKPQYIVWSLKSENQLSNIIVPSKINTLNISSSLCCA